MHQQQHKAGSSLIIGLVVLVVIGLGVFYVVSDPFNTKVGIAFSGATEWTPENIKNDPVAYLTWAVKKCDASVSQLETGKIALTIRRNKTQKKSQSLTNEITDGKKKLSKAKTLFKETTTWPLVLNGNNISKDQLKAKIVSSHNNITNKEKLAQSHTKTTSVIAKKLNEIKSKLVEAQQMKEKIATDLEIAKTNKAVAGISDIGSELSAIIATSDALSGAGTDDMSLDDLLGDGSETANDEAFDSIMAE